jgi:hypothetical protein
MVEYGGTVLRAAVDKLTTGVRRVHVPPKYVKKFFISDFGGIVNNLHGFDMLGPAGADIFITRVLGRSAGVSGDGLNHSVGLLKIRFAAPKAASRERRFFEIIGVGFHFTRFFGWGLGCCMNSRENGPREYDRYDEKLAFHEMPSTGSETG